jgi:putative two-component system response regulator
MTQPFPRLPRILVVDDEQINIQVLERILDPGYVQITSTTDPRRAVGLFREIQPDLVLLDLRMPHLDGLELLELLSREIPTAEYLPILVLTSDSSGETKRRALSGGAKDFLTKPLSPFEVRLRVQNLLETRFLHLQLQEQNRSLEERVIDRTRALLQRSEELEEARIEILERLARAAEFRDDDTGQHTQRVGQLAAQLAAVLALPTDLIELIRRAAPLHDLGKIGVPDTVLLKRGRLDAAEYDVMKRHTVIGGAILSGSSVPLLAMGREIAVSHHERWDGTGYPFGEAGAAIPVSGRIVAVADVFDALTHGRPYKSAWSVDEATAEISRERGRQFDPDVVDAFLEIGREGALSVPVPAMPSLPKAARPERVPA